MPASTSRLTLPYPIATDPADVPADLQALAGALDPKAAVFAQGTAAARPAAGVPGRLYYATDSGLITYDTGSAWTAFAVSGAPPLVTALPGSPADGQEVYYQSAAMATDGIVWHLRYRTGAPGAYKWEFVGGSSLMADISTEQQINSTGAWLDLATAGPAVTVPLAGEYEMEAYAAIRGQATFTCSAGVKIGAATPVDTLINSWGNGGGTVNDGGHGGRRLRRTVSAAATALTLQYFLSSGGPAFVGNRTLAVRPARVG